MSIEHTAQQQATVDWVLLTKYIRLFYRSLCYLRFDYFVQSAMIKAPF